MRDFAFGRDIKKLNRIKIRTFRSSRYLIEALMQLLSQLLRAMFPPRQQVHCGATDIDIGDHTSQKSASRCRQGPLHLRLHLPTAYFELTAQSL